MSVFLIVFYFIQINLYYSLTSAMIDICQPKIPVTEHYLV